MHPDKTLYLKRYAAGKRLLEPPAIPPDLVITIPAHREPDLRSTLASLNQCAVSVPTEVLLLLNYSETDTAEIKHQHKELYDQLITENWDRKNLSFHFLLKELPSKHAGVGLARKILMDEAVRRTDGIIAALDADSSVLPDYLEALSEFFSSHPKIQGASIRFEHPLPMDTEARNAIVNYELHLRYFVEAQRFLNLPFAYHTVGSSMAVRSLAYCRAGGMNRRKAGEDFYFLQRIIPQGFGEINTTCVMPSPRISDRVPFGTGKAIGDLISHRKLPLSYAPENFLIIKYLLELIFNNMLFINKLSEAQRNLVHYLQLEEHLLRIKNNSASEESFRKNFFNWFDGFMLMKCLHFLRDHHCPDIPVADAASWLLKNFRQIEPGRDIESLLVQYRMIQIVN